MSVSTFFARSKPEADPCTMQRRRMVREQIQARGVRDPRVLAAMQKVPRHLFMPGADCETSYADHPYPIGCGQTISQPYIVAYMTEAAEVQPGSRVLEIGTGCGYQTAILAELAQHVVSLELEIELAGSARQRLTEQGYDNVTVLCADGYHGHGANAPYDVILCAAAPPEVPNALLAQLSHNGRLIIPVGEGEQQLFRYQKKDGQVSGEPLISVRFVPMR